MREERWEDREDREGESEVIPGIVVTDGSTDPRAGRDRPRISAFIWGGKVRPAPTLPFGRWKGAA